jgi:hypothetical protein
MVPRLYKWTRRITASAGRALLTNPLFLAVKHPFSHHLHPKTPTSSNNLKPNNSISRILILVPLTLRHSTKAIGHFEQPRMFLDANAAFESRVSVKVPVVAIVNSLAPAVSFVARGKGENAAQEIIN